MKLGNLTYERTFEDAVVRLVKLGYPPYSLIPSAHKLVRAFEKTGFDKEFTLALAERRLLDSNVLLPHELSGMIDHYLRIRDEVGTQRAIEISTAIN